MEEVKREWGDEGEVGERMRVKRVVEKEDLGRKKEGMEEKLGGEREGKKGGGKIGRDGRRSKMEGTGKRGR